MAATAKAEAVEAPDAPRSETWQPPVLAVIVPSYNERDNIALLFDRITTALGEIPFEFIVVDDNSPDGTAGVVREMARRHPNVRCLQRIGRRGLSSAVTEGMAATAAPYIAVIDGDLQHDETILPEMLRRALEGDDVVVGTRYAGEGSATGGLSSARERGSRLATRLSALLTGVTLSDPMSGYFLIRREVFADIAPTLSRDGFKILLDLIVSATRFRSSAATRELRISEVPYEFRARHSGESKLSALVVVQFLGLLLSKLTRGLLPTSFLLFGMVGGTGVVVHLVTLWAAHELRLDFAYAQLVATLVAMSSNFVLNNMLTYADKKLRGYRFWLGLLSFYVVCSIGTLANISVASWIYQASPDLFLAGIAGALMSVVFNYSVTRVFTWR